MGIYDRFANSRLLVKTILGFAIALILVYLLGVVVGWSDIQRALSDTELDWVGLACLSTLVGLVAWTKVWQIVLGVVGIHIRTHRLVVTYFAATFANYITPFGQAGGEPFIAYVLSQTTDASYEDSLASVVTADVLNLLPFFNFAVLGLAVIAIRANLPEIVRPVVYGLVVLAIGIPLIAYAAWSHRVQVERIVLKVFAPIITRSPRISVAGIKTRIAEFYSSLDIITGRPRTLQYALVFSYIGWVLFALPLYFAAAAVQFPIDPLLVLFIVPASAIAGFIPTPGGLGGVEAALIAFLVVLTAVPGGQAFAIATIYRLASYWFALGIGGVAMLWVVVRA